MARSRDQLDRVSTILGLATGLAGLFVSFIAELPRSSVLPLVFASAALIIVPLGTRRAQNALPMADARKVVHLQRAIWGLTALLLASLVASHMVWQPMPSRIRSSVIDPSTYSPSSLFIAEFGTQAGQTDVPHLMTNPVSAVEEWSKDPEISGDLIPIVGVLVASNASGGGQPEYSVRIIPAVRFFTLERGPVPFFESALRSWLWILLVLEAAVVYGVPWLAGQLAEFRNSSQQTSC